MAKLSKKTYLGALMILFFGFGFFLPIFAAQAPTVLTKEASGIASSLATLTGEVTDCGGDCQLNVWFQYGKNASFGSQTAYQNQSSVGSFSAQISNLSPCALYYFRAVAKNNSYAGYGPTKTFTTQCPSAAVDLKIDNSDGPITISYNTAAALTWNSGNVSSCYASGDWSGTKPTSGIESTGKLTSSKTYTITCTGSAGSVSDSVTVNVSSQVVSEFYIKQTVRNLSKGTAFEDIAYAVPGEVMTFGIVIRAGNNPLYNVVVKQTLPPRIIYQGDLKVDDIASAGNIFTGLNIGNIPAGEKKTITFRADIASAGNFGFGQTELIGTALASSGSLSHSDTAKIIVTRSAVIGNATEAPTGLTNNLFLDSFFLPLVITFLIIFLFKSRIIKFEEWMDSRKQEYGIYKSKKLLQMKIIKIKAQELFKKIQ